MAVLSFYGFLKIISFAFSLAEPRWPGGTSWPQKHKLAMAGDVYPLNTPHRLSYQTPTIVY